MDLNFVDSGETLRSPDSRFECTIIGERLSLLVRAKICLGFCSQFSVCMRIGRAISSVRDVDGLVWLQVSPQSIISTDSGIFGLRIAPVGGISRTISDSSECITLQRGTSSSTPLGDESRSVGWGFLPAYFDVCAVDALHNVQLYQQAAVVISN